MPRARSKIRGEWRICSNPACRRRFSTNTRTYNARLMQNGRCPRCVTLIAAREAEALNPKLYAECQRINKAEHRYSSGTSHSSQRRARALEREALKRYEAWAAKAALPITQAERLLTNGYTPTANNGKCGGGPRRGGDSGSNEGRY